jgi:hypothetical protein
MINLHGQITRCFVLLLIDVAAINIIVPLTIDNSPPVNIIYTYSINEHLGIIKSLFYKYKNN